MYKCKVCNKIYPNRVDYCECGSSEFGPVAQNRPQQQNTKPKNKDTVSWIIFGICVFIALIIWFI